MTTRIHKHRNLEEVLTEVQNAQKTRPLKNIENFELCMRCMQGVYIWTFRYKLLQIEDSEKYLAGKEASFMTTQYCNHRDANFSNERKGFWGGWQ